MYNKTIFDNGLILLTYQMKQVHSASVGIWIKVGSRYETEHLSGISHLLEHMVFKGSRKYDKDSIKQNIEGKGGSLNGFTAEELTCYLAKVPKENIFSSLDILFDMYTHPLLKEEDLLREKTVIIEEIKMYKDLPQHIVQEQLDLLMWPNHQLGRNIAGTVETVSNIDIISLKSFHNKYYVPNNSVVVIAGAVEHKSCERFLKKIIKKHEFSKARFDFEVFNNKQKEIRIKETKKEIEQTHLAIGFNSYSYRHPRRFIVNLLAIILGGNMSSRLFDKIRERYGLAYEISAQCKYFFETGAFYIHAGLDNKKIELAINLIMKELNKLKRIAVGQAELKRAKEFYLGQLAISLDDTLDHMIFLGNSFCNLGKQIDFNFIKKQIDSITPNDLLEVSREIFHDKNINLSLVGPINNFDREEVIRNIFRYLG